jgi:hypothetical protein
MADQCRYEGAGAIDETTLTTPFLSKDSYVNDQEEFNLEFNTVSQTFDLVIRSQRHQEIRFQHVSIPYPFNWLLPLPAGRQVVIFN